MISVISLIQQLLCSHLQVRLRGNRIIANDLPCLLPTSLCSGIFDILKLSLLEIIQVCQKKNRVILLELLSFSVCLPQIKVCRAHTAVSGLSSQQILLKLSEKEKKKKNFDQFQARTLNLERNPALKVALLPHLCGLY